MDELLNPGLGQTTDPEEMVVPGETSEDAMFDYGEHKVSDSLKEEMLARSAIETQKAAEQPEVKSETLTEEPVKEKVVMPTTIVKELKPIVRNATIMHPVEKVYDSSNVLAVAMKAMLGEDGTGNVIPSLRAVKLFKEIETEMVGLEESGSVDEYDALVELTQNLINMMDITGVDDVLCMNPKADLRQGFLNKQNELLGTRRISDARVKGNLKGDIANYKILKFLGLGEPVQVLLPHSCFWVTVMPPNENEIISYYNMISRNQKRLGRESKGLTFGNMSVAIKEELFRFIKRNVTGMTLEGVGKEDLDLVMMEDDFPFLLAGFLGSFSPDGAPFKRICNGEKPDKTACGRVADVMLDVDKLAWIDNSRLTEFQKEIMSFLTPRSVSMKDYQECRNQFVSPEISSLTVEGMTFEFKRPTFREHVDDGMDWIDSITSEFNKVLSSGIWTEREKEELLAQFIKASTLRNYSHYIKSISYADVVVNDVEAIRENLARISSKDSISGPLEEAVVKFRNESVIGVIGVPEYQCPDCGKMELVEDPDNKIRNIIPLDIMAIYFLMFNTKFHATIVGSTTA